MKKKHNKVLTIILTICLVLTNLEPLTILASEVSIEEIEKVNSEELYPSVSEGDSKSEEDDEKIGADEQADDKVIVSFEELPSEVATMEVYSKPPYEELIKCLPTTLVIYTKDGNSSEIETKWIESENYENAWEQITFEARIDDTYVLEEDVVLPSINVVMILPYDNGGIMNIGDEVLQGTGTSEEPFLIYTVEDFEFVRANNDAGIFYKLMSDIDLSSTTWIPLGLSNTDDEAFCANFDGNGHKIYNLEKISSSYSHYGVFGYVRNASISNLGIVVKSGTQISSPKSGGIMMKIGTNCTINNCYVIGEYVTTSKDAQYAGILAQSCSGTISNCFVQGAVLVYGNSSLTHAAYANSGGIIGTGDATITNCVCYADVLCKSSSRSSYSGGISCGGNTVIQNCLFIGETRLGTGKVVGQIYGYTGNTSPSVSNSYYMIENSADPNKEKYGIGKTVFELRDMSTYEGWDFENIWTMSDENNAGFPMLKSMVDVERTISKYLLPTPVDYSQRSGQVILSNEFEFMVYFDRDIEVVQNGGVYLKDSSSDSTIACSYTVVNDNELYIKTEEPMLNGTKYTLVISNNCIADVAYPSNYYVGQSGTYFVTVCKPKFEGDGSVENPYIVSDVERLNCVYYQPTMNYVLSNDIDASSVSRVNSIGGCKDTSGTSGAWFSHYDTQTQGEKSDFTGTFDGNGYTISGIKRFSGQCVGGYAYDKYIGLFSSVNGGTIKNLNVLMAEDCYLYNERGGSIVDTYAYPYLSILVAKGNGTISNCTVSGTVYSNQETTYAGMIAGYFSGVIENCAAYGSVSNEYNSSNAIAGGLVGHLTNTGSIRNCYSIVSVNGSSKCSVGGLVGNNKGLVANTYAAGTVSKMTKAGGLIGVNTGNVQNSFYDCTISGLLDNDRGTPKTSSSMKSIGTFYTWDFTNCWAINSKHNGGYPFLKECKGAEIIAGTPTVITVFDGTDGTKVIQNPTISFINDNGEVVTAYQGDENGVITMEDIVISNTYNIEISADGYGTYLNEKYSLNAFSTHIILLYPETDTPTVYCANMTVSGKDNNYVDILQKKKSLVKGDTVTYDIYVAATYSGGIDSICLVQGGKVKKKSSTGIFTNISADDFDTSVPIYIEAIGKDGNTSKLYQTYLNISTVLPEPVDGDFELSNGISIDIDSDVPIIGGATLSLNDLFDELEILQLEIDEGKTRFTVNIDPELVNGKTSIKDTTEIRKIDFLQLEKLLNYSSASDGKITSGIKQYYEQLKQFTEEYGDLIPNNNVYSFISGTGNAEIDGKMFGYLEVDNSTLEICGGKIALFINSEVKYESGIAIGPVPCVLIIDLSASAEGSITVKIYDGEFVYDYSGTLKAGLSAGIGPGIPKLASITLNGSGELAFIYDWNTYLKKHSTIVNLTASSYWKLKILAFELEKNITESQWCLYDSNVAQTASYSLMAYSEDDEIGEEQFKVSDISEDSNWNEAAGKARTIGADTDIELLSSVYANSSPQIVQMGDDMMIVYSHQNASRTAINSTEVVYSIYDSTTQTWSIPQAVNDDGTADFYPQVIENSGEIYVVWENMSEVATDETGLSEFAALGKTSIAKYEPTSDSFVSCTSSIGGMISNPCLDSTAGKVMWVLNESDDFLNDSAYSIQIADYDGEAISNISTLQSGIEHLIMAKIGMSGTEVVAAYIYDCDGNYLTMDDHVLKVIDLQGKELHESEESAISDVEFINKDSQQLIAYSKDGSIMILDDYVADTVIEGNVSVTGEFSFVDGDMDYILFEVPNSGENSEIDLYAYTYDSVSGTWNNAVPITNMDSQITAYDAIAYGEGIQLVYQDSIVNNGTEVASLHTKKVEPTINLGIGNLVYNEEYNKLSVSADITNAGLKSVTGYSVTVYDGATAIYTETKNEQIGIGENVRYELELETTSVSGYEKTLDIVVTPIAGVEVDDSDNKESIVVGYPDVSVSLADEAMGENTYIAYLKLCNSGNYVTSGVVNVYVFDTLIDSIPVADLSTGEYRDVQVKIDTSQFDYEDYVGLVKFEFVSEMDELYLHNNVVTSNIYVEMNALLGAVDAEDVSIVVGEKAELSLEFGASSGNSSRLVIMPMSYSVEDSTIAVIGEDGNVTGVKEGSTTLTIVATDLYGNSATDTCNINVSSGESGDDFENDGDAGNGSNSENDEDTGSGSDSENGEDEGNGSDSEDVGDVESGSNSENDEDMGSGSDSENGEYAGSGSGSEEVGDVGNGSNSENSTDAESGITSEKNEDAEHGSDLGITNDNAAGNDLASEEQKEEIDESESAFLAESGSDKSVEVGNFDYEKENGGNTVVVLAIFGVFAIVGAIIYIVGYRKKRE